MVSLTFALIIASCDCRIESQEEDALFNIWVNYDDDFSAPVTLKSSNKFDHYHPGFEIRSDGEFIERKNSGWCGTPPIAYANYSGVWEKISADTLEITVEYWGGIENYKIEILSVDENELLINYVYSHEE